MEAKEEKTPKAETAEKLVEAKEETEAEEPKVEEAKTEETKKEEV